MYLARLLQNQWISRNADIVVRYDRIETQTKVIKINRL